MNLLRLFLLCLAAALCASCQTPPEADGAYRLADHPNQGIAVVSTRIDNQCNSGLLNSGSVGFQSEDGKKYGRFPLDNTFTRKDFQNPPGYMIVEPLPAGPYRLISVSFNVYKSAEIELGFTIVAGKVNYLGELSFLVPDCSRIRHRVTDMWERDEQIVRQKLKNYPTGQVEKQIMRP